MPAPAPTSASIEAPAKDSYDRMLDSDLGQLGDMTDLDMDVGAMFEGDSGFAEGGIEYVQWCTSVLHRLCS